MSDSLLSELSGLLSPDLVSNLAGNVGESSGAISKGLSAVFPALLGGVATKADDAGFMWSPVGMVNDSSIDESVLDRPQSLIGSAAKSLPAMLAGGKLLGSVFGNNIDGLVGKVAGFAGINPSTARSAVHPAPVEKKSIWRYVIPLLLVLAVFWLLSQFLGRDDDARVTEPATTSTPATAVAQFASDSDDLPMNAGDSLGTVSRYLAANPGARATVTGYLDSSDDATGARARAAAVREALIQAGVSSGQIDVAEPGSTTDMGTTEDAKRVEVDVTN